MDTATEAIPEDLNVAKALFDVIRHVERRLGVEAAVAACGCCWKIGAFIVRARKTWPANPGWRVFATHVVELKFANHDPHHDSSGWAVSLQNEGGTVMEANWVFLNKLLDELRS